MGGVVVDLLGNHGADDADLVGDRSCVGEKVGNLDARLAVFLKAGEGAAGDELGTLELGELLAFGERFRERLAVELVQFRLGIEGFQVRGAAGHAEVDHAFRLRREVESALLLDHRQAGAALRVRELREGDPAETGKGFFQERPARPVVLEGVVEVVVVHGEEEGVRG